MRQDHRVAGLRFVASLILFGACVIAPGQAAAENIKIGSIKITVLGPLFLAQEKGYFASEGLSAELVLFDQPQQLVPAVLAGDLDFSVTAPSASLFNLAENGSIKIISGVGLEAAGFTGNAIVGSNASFNAGLKTLKDIGGHSVAMAALGTIPHYELGVIADKYGFDLKTVKLIQNGSIANSISAVVGGGADVGILPWSAVKPTLQRQDMQLLASIGDVMRTQLTVNVASKATTDNRPDAVNRYLRVFRKGLIEYRDAFVGPGETRHDGTSAPQVFAVIAKYLGQPVALVQQGVGYISPELQLDVRDVLHQLDWYKSQSMVKPGVDGEKIIDRRYVVALPDK